MQLKMYTPGKDQKVTIDCDDQAIVIKCERADVATFLHFLADEACKNAQTVRETKPSDDTVATRTRVTIGVDTDHQYDSGTFHAT